MITYQIRNDDIIILNEFNNSIFLVIKDHKNGISIRMDYESFEYLKGRVKRLSDKLKRRKENKKRRTKERLKMHKLWH